MDIKEITLFIFAYCSPFCAGLVKGALENHSPQKMFRAAWILWSGSVPKMMMFRGSGGLGGGLGSNKKPGHARWIEVIGTGNHSAL